MIYVLLKRCSDTFHVHVSGSRVTFPDNQTARKEADAIAKTVYGLCMHYSEALRPQVVIDMRNASVSQWNDPANIVGMVEFRKPWYEYLPPPRPTN
jgi:hypothetical protein